MSDFPEEYIDGYVIFMGRRFITDHRALIPRLETEELVKYCLKFLQKNPNIKTIADIGTGSGIIPISITEKTKRPLQVFATDLSQEALSLAGENIQRIKNSNSCSSSSGKGDSCDSKGECDPVIQENNLLGNGSCNISGLDSRSTGTPTFITRSEFVIPSLRENGGITFLHGDLLQPLITHFGKNVPEEILITANLPYVREIEINSGLMHEPRMAFLGGVQTGFELYERFFDQLLAWKNRPKNCHVVIEFGMWQRDIAETLFQKHGLQYAFFADLRGIERFAHIF